MKKALSLTAAAILTVTSLLPAAYADEDHKLPFELTPPENVFITYLDGRDSENTCRVVYGQNASMSEWATKNGDPESHDATVEEFQALGYDDLWITPQMDWSIDSTDDWHYNEYWDNDGYDEDNRQHLGDWAYTSLSYSSETTNESWVFRGMGNIEDPEDWTWHGRHEDGEDIDGWKDVLKEDQYEVIKGEDESHAKIDLTNHTIYVRMRYLVTARTSEEDLKIASDWSETAAVGKDGDSVDKLKEGDLSAPVISDLRMTDEDFNGYHVIAFKIDIPDELSKADASLKARDEGYISIEVSARIPDKTDWVELQGDFTLKSGELKYGLQNLAEVAEDVSKDTPIELRARFYEVGEDEIYSDYSEVLTFGSEEMHKPDESIPEESNPDEADTAEEKAETESKISEKEKEDDSKCPLCGFCSQPLGLCLFIWIAIAVAVIIVIVIIVVVSRKKKKNN